MTFPRVSLLGLFLAGVLVGPVSAQDDKPKEDDKPPAPEQLQLVTKDNVTLECTYYPSNRKKEAVPVILLHGLGGAQQDVAPLARTLHESGHAVIIGDLRGHGRSTKMRTPQGDIEELDYQEMRPNDFKGMLWDVEAMKKHLMEENNKGKLNIELLCVVGVEMGATLGMDWSIMDWSWPQLPAFKQGQDVKALVVISPPRREKAFMMTSFLRHPILREKLSMMIIVGSKSRAFADARSLHRTLSRYHHEPAEEDRREQQDLWLIDPDTTLEGAKLLDAEGLNIHDNIKGFIQLRLVNKIDLFPWKLRESPLQ